MSTRQYVPHEEHPCFMLSLEGVWVPCTFGHAGQVVWINEKFDGEKVKGGMSGSPILDIDGAVVGVISTGGWGNPRLSANLPSWLLAEI